MASSVRQWMFQLDFYLRKYVHKYFTLLLFLLFALFVWLYLSLHLAYTLNVHDYEVASDHNKFTVRLNTFRRNDLLELSLNHLVTCPEIKEIQVIWSDTKNKPPPLSTLFPFKTHKELKKLSKRIQIEVHDRNSINARFRPLLPIPTPSVLSIDDDLIIPCNTLKHAFSLWQASPSSMVGFSPRLHSLEPFSARFVYNSWRSTYWNGAYSIMLSKVAFLPSQALFAFDALVSEPLLAFIDEHKNCEDIAMSYVSAFLSTMPVHPDWRTPAGTKDSWLAFLAASSSDTSLPLSPPRWLKSTVYENAEVGISSGTSHMAHRSNCVHLFAQHFGLLKEKLYDEKDDNEHEEIWSALKKIAKQTKGKEEEGKKRGGEEDNRDGEGFLLPVSYAKYVIISPAYEMVRHWYRTFL